MDKILLVDDVKLLLEIEKGLLEGSKVQVVTAMDGQQALAIAREELPQLIVMDKHMPNMDGLTCCREIRQDPRLKDIPVILMSNAVDVEELRSNGFTDFIRKPVERKHFLTTIRNYVPAVERRGIRVPLTAEATIIMATGLCRGFTINISKQGVQAFCDRSPNPGDELLLSFQLPDSEAPIEVRGRVVWSRQKTHEGRSGAVFGTEIIEITGKGLPFMRQRDLKRYILEQCGPDQAPTGKSSSVVDVLRL